MRETIRLTFTKKKKKLNIAHNKGEILHVFKESEEFIDTLVRILKMSKSIITFKLNLYKLLKKYSSLKYSSKSFT